MKKITIIALIIGVFVYILHSYGALDNMLTSKQIDKILVTTINDADKAVDDAVIKKAAQTILNKNR